MTVELIGTWAGLVWQALNEADALGLAQIKKITKLKNNEIYAALGWLSREGKLLIEPDPADPKGEKVIVSLLQ